LFNVTGSDLTAKELDIKVIEGQSPVSNFKIKPESVVQITEGENLMVFTQPPDQVDKVKLTNVAGDMIDIR
jgi:hypothetical protein